MDNLKQLVVILLVAIFASTGMMLLQYNQNVYASDSDEICSTWSDISKDCENNIATNCACPIIVTPDE